MKRIVFTCLILSGSLTAALAQSAVGNPTVPHEQKVPAKLLFSSKINEYYAFATRNNAAKAQKAFDEAGNMMHMQIDDNLKKMGATSDKDAKAALSELTKKQLSLYTGIRGLSADLMTKKDDIQGKMKEFMMTM